MLFPTQWLETIIRPAWLNNPGGFFERDEALATQPVAVDVQPLPADAPAGFNGAVGQFSLAAVAAAAAAAVGSAGVAAPAAPPPLPDGPRRPAAQPTGPQKSAANVGLGTEKSGRSLCRLYYIICHRQVCDNLNITPMMTVTNAGTLAAMTHILIVDDDALVRRGLGFDLEQANYRISTAANAEDALALAQRDRPDLVLLDIGLPGMDGLDALRHFRQSVGDVPIIFMTARRCDMDRILGLELGADDYITKPFNSAVLRARMKAVLRRAQPPVGPLTIPDPIEVGNILIDPSGHTVTVGGQLVELTAREFGLLHALALRPGHVLSVDELLPIVWGAEFMGEPQVVYVHIRRLRSKIEMDPDNPQHIITVRGVGYKLVATDH